MKIMLAKQKMEREEGLNHVLATLTPKSPTKKIEKPSAFVLIVDESYSMEQSVTNEGQPYMQGQTFIGNQPFVGNKPFPFHRTEKRMTKLDYVKQAAEKFVDSLKDGNKLGIVSFSDIAQLVYPLTDINQEERFQMKDRIQRLHVKGNTNISDGLQLAYDQISENLKETHHIKMILLSDGEANYGIQDVDGITSFIRKFQDKDVSISTIGVGLSYNSYFMENIATVSGGGFYHLKEMSLLQDIFQKELTLLTGLTMKRATLQIKTTEGLHLEENLNGYEEVEKGKMYVGNVYQELKIAYELATKESVKGDSVSVTVILQYEDEEDVRHTVEKTIDIPLVDEDELAVNEEVISYVKQLMEAKTRREALRHYEASDVNNTKLAFRKASSTLHKMQNSYQMNVNDMQTSLDSLEQNMTTRQMNSDQVKEMYITSYNVMRNQKDKKEE